MYKHEIVVFKPLVVAPQQPWTPPPTPRKYKTQQEYNEFLDTLEFAVGDYITLCHQPVDYAGQVWKVLEVQTDVDKVNYKSYVPYHPCPIQVRQLPTPTRSDFPVQTRWESTSGYRKLTEAEIARVVSV